MQRLIYCPGNEKLDEASNLSKKLSLPIVVGESESISSIKFDRESVSVLVIPEKNNIFFIENVNSGFHQSVRYTNEFAEFNNTLVLEDGEFKFKPILMEKHYCHFVYACNFVGNRSFSVVMDGVVLEKRNYFVG